MEFKPFRIEDKARIDSYFAVHHYEQIDCTFNTLFLWQDAYQTSWAEQDGILFRPRRDREGYLLHAAVCQGGGGKFRTRACPHP